MSPATPALWHRDVDGRLSQWGSAVGKRLRLDRVRAGGRGRRDRDAPCGYGGGGHNRGVGRLRSRLPDDRHADQVGGCSRRAFYRESRAAGDRSRGSRAGDRRRLGPCVLRTRHRADDDQEPRQLAKDFYRLLLDLELHYRARRVRLAGYPQSYAASEMTSPPFRVPRALQVALEIELFRKPTCPSA